MKRSAAAFERYRLTDPATRADFLEKIASNIEALGPALIDQASAETNLPAPRLEGERARTTMQLRMFADMLREGSWVEASIDTADPSRKPLPKPDLRRMSIPLGPVIVFGASNFPFAYSTAGGDTASALAAGCTVVVKAHPAHLKTSVMVAGCIRDAVKSCGMPEDCFLHSEDGSVEAGLELVKHPLTAAVGFTGSFAGGKALFDAAAARKTPIPVFSEMGSVNPVLILPDALATHAADTARQYAASITLGMGQFCTNPGLLMTIDGTCLDEFEEVLGAEVSKVAPADMLHPGIRKAYFEKREKALAEPGVDTIGRSSAAATGIQAEPLVARVSGREFLENQTLHEEVFGPYSLLIVCQDMQELIAVWKSAAGQLTTSLIGTSKDFSSHPELTGIAEGIAGRIVYNGVPTGVEVCNSMVHGGPFPACTDSRFSAVGISGVRRWVRPVCYQNCPANLLPAALRDENPLGIWRLVNNEWTKAGVA